MEKLSSIFGDKKLKKTTKYYPEYDLSIPRKNKRNITAEKEELDASTVENKCEKDDLRKCKNCSKMFKSRKDHRNVCSECYNLSQKNIQRKRASSLEGYFKQTLSAIKNGRKNRDCELTVDFLCELYKNQNGKCAISGIEMTLGDKRNGVAGNPFSISIDRKDNNLGYTLDNVWLIINAINQFKGIHDLSTVFDIVKAIYKFNDLK